MPIYLRSGGVWVDLATGVTTGTPPTSSTTVTTIVTAQPAVTGRDTLVLGAYRPDASTTGVPAGTTLTVTSSHSPVSGTATVPTVYTALDIRNSIDMFGKGNITYRNCVFRGKPGPLSGGAQGLVSLIRPNLGNISFIDCTFIPQTPDYRWVGVHGCYGATILRCDFSILVDAMQVFTTGAGTLDDPCNAIIRQNYIHDHAFFQPGAGGGETSTNGSHSDGIQWEGGPGLIVQGNYFTGKLAPAYVPGLAPPSGNVNSNSCMMIKPDVGAIGGGNISQNWFGGGGVPINIADDPTGGRYINDLGSLVTNRFYRDNTFYPTMILIGSVAGGTHTSIGGTYTGNVFDDDNTAVPVTRTQA